MFFGGGGGVLGCAALSRSEAAKNKKSAGVGCHIPATVEAVSA